MKRYLIAALLAPLPAFAAEGEKASVPQFDPSTYAGQLFWLVIMFALLYMLMARIALPRAGFVLEQRAQRQRQDIEQAEAARDRSAALQTGFETGMNAARTEARETLATATATAQAAQTTALATQNQQLTARIQQAEASIAAARISALAIIRPAAASLADELVRKLSAGK